MDWKKYSGALQHHSFKDLGTKRKLMIESTDNKEDSPHTKEQEKEQPPAKI
jgi:hypothetical protein